MHQGIALPQRSLVSQEDQSMIQRPDVPRSTFIGSWSHKTTFDAGYLIPFLVDEVLPGDHMSYDVAAYLRMATPLFPLFSNQRLDTFFFFVPYRILWTNWQRFMGQQDSPGDSIAYTVPTVSGGPGGAGVGSIYDYMGFPTQGQVTAGQTNLGVAFPFRAYYRIWNDWFRDQNSVNGLTVVTADSGDPTYVLQRRMKSHDYFTTCLPWPQKFTAPTIALGTSAPVRGISTLSGAWPGPAQAAGFEVTGGAAQPGYTTGFSTAAGDLSFQSSGLGVYADLSAATGISINTLRLAFLTQQFLERDARGGTRYTEIVKSHFGVTSPDARLQRPEYIGGGSTPLTVTPIAQTATGGAGLGSVGGAGTAFGQHRATYAATEHGVILGLVNVRTELMYQQGFHRSWSRRVRTDYYFPSLAGLGEQAVLREEIYATGVDADDATVFGYQERWQEYRTRYSYATGLFRSTSTGNIDEWHLGQQFTAAPVLGATFLQEDPPMTRVLSAGAAANGMQYLADIQINRTAVRPIPVYGTPVALGRF